MSEHSAKGLWRECGFSLLELLAVLSTAGVLTLMASAGLNDMVDPLRNASAELQGYFKQVRARAIATTSSYTVVPSGTGTVTATFSDSCSSSDQTADGRLLLNLPSGARFSATDWSVCYTARGLPLENLQIELADNDGESRTLEIYLGGAVREVDPA